MWTSPRRSRATRTGRSHAIGVAVALLACVGFTACSATETPSPASTEGPDTVAPLPEPPTGELEPLDPGTYLVTNFTVPFEITVPDGWKSFGWGVLKEDAEADESQVFVNFVEAGLFVPTDGCAWRNAESVDVDPSLEGFVAALASQASSETTSPVEATVGEYSGLEFDISVGSDVDLTDCDESTICLFGGSVNDWSRAMQNPDHRETARVLDLNGELVMISGGQFRAVDPALRQEARAVLDSIAFAPWE